MRARTAPSAVEDVGSVTAVVPLRDGTSGKTRLAPALDPELRAALVAVLARHVVATLVESTLVARVAVVTADRAFAATVVGGLGPGVEVVEQPPAGGGLNGAVALGRDIACERGAQALLVVHADLAALGPMDVEALLRPAAPVVLAPDRFGTGTNALVLRPAGRGFTFRFGPDSLAAHRAEAASRGLEPRIVERQGTATDLDTVADWDRLPPDARERVMRALPAMASLAALP
ncbi:MAG: 2-phospho-L-lactate guanylyltransferase CofC [Actinotalea sp.]|nr:2-phospho-L-lactate guanylyltransferase CofC [Actinotalea sp.]